MTRRPSPEDMETAAAWLDANEGAGGEADACHRIAEWLKDQAHDQVIRRHARRANIPVKLVRARLAKIAAARDDGGNP